LAFLSPYINNSSWPQCFLCQGRVLKEKKRLSIVNPFWGKIEHELFSFNTAVSSCRIPLISV
jgi:hypothetical protein